MTLQDYLNWLSGLSETDRGNLSDNALSLYGLPMSGGDSQLRQWIWDYAKGKYGDDYKGLQGYLTSIHGFNYNPEWESWLNNMIASQNTGEQNDWSQMMRDTNIESDASQLAALGLNPASVISMNRSQTPVADAAAVDYSDNANSRIAREFQRRQNIMNKMFSLLSGMSAAGLGFAALKGPKFIASRMAQSTAKAAKKAFSTGKVTEPLRNPHDRPNIVSSRVLYRDRDYNDLWN